MVTALLFILQVKGMKGAPVLCCHKPFNLVKWIVIDHMHCILLGVTKTLLRLWFNKTNAGLSFYMGGKVTYKIAIM